MLFLVKHFFLALHVVVQVAAHLRLGRMQMLDVLTSDHVLEVMDICSQEVILLHEHHEAVLRHGIVLVGMDQVMLLLPLVVLP